MANPNAIDYIGKKLEEVANDDWFFKNISYQGPIVLPKSKDRAYSFGDVNVVLKPKGDLWIEGHIYRNFVSADSYQSAKEAVDKIHEHLSYIDTYHQRLKDTPEDWAPQGFLARLKKNISS